MQVEVGLVLLATAWFTLYIADLLYTYALLYIYGGPEGLVREANPIIAYIMERYGLDRSFIIVALMKTTAYLAVLAATYITYTKSGSDQAVLVLLSMSLLLTLVLALSIASTIYGIISQ